MNQPKMMPNKNLIKLRGDLRFQPLFSGFSMHIDHLHPIFSGLRLFRKDLPYLYRSDVQNFNLWYVMQNNEFKVAFQKLKIFSGNWSGFLDHLAEQSGYCLDSLYEKIPEEVKGSVELFYTGLNKPGYKLNALVYDINIIESLHSFGFYNAKAIPNYSYWWGNVPAEFQLKRPLSHLSCMALTDLILAPSDFDVVYEKISLDVDREALEFITEECFADVNSEDSNDESIIEINYINHATVVIKRGKLTALVDPLLNFYDQNNDISLYEYAPKNINYVLITHAHYDHIDIPTLVTLRNRIGKILLPRASGVESDYNLKNALEPYFPGRVVEIDSFEEIEVGKEFKIISLPFQGEHADLISPKTTWLVAVSGKNFWFGADSRVLDIGLHKLIRAKYGSLEAMFIGTVCEGSTLSRAYPHYSMNVTETNSNSRLTKGADHQEIYEMIDALNPNSLYIYALGYERWFKYFLGEPIHRYSEEFDLLAKLLAKKNKTLKRMSLLIYPQRLSV